MATQFATLNRTAPGVPMDAIFPMHTSVHDRLMVHSKQNGASPVQKPSFDPGPLLNRVLSGQARLAYAVGESIFSQGDLANAVYYIQSGKVKLTVVSKSGKEAVIAHLLESSFFGESSLAGEVLRVSSAEALEASIIVRIEKSAMLGLIEREPEFASKFLTHMLSRNVRMEADLVDHLFNSSEKRLARLLMLMANFGQDSKPIPVIAKISQETLAEMIGTTRSRVSFFLNRFREFGYIDYNSGGMLIKNSLVNVVLHD